jgi:hypothetical protein
LKQAQALLSAGTTKTYGHNLDPGVSLKSGPVPQQFHFGPAFEIGPGLIICGHHHDTWPR